MAFRRKTDTGSGEQFKFEKVGQSLIGYYLGSFDHDGEYGPTKKHVFKTKKGLKVVFGQTHLMQLLEGEKPGPLMQITYIGDKKMKKGNPMKEYALDIDTDEQLDSDELPGEIENATEPEEYEASEQSEESEQVEDEPAEEEEEETPADEVKTAPARSLAPKTGTNKPAIQAILAKRGVKTKTA